MANTSAGKVIERSTTNQVQVIKKVYTGTGWAVERESQGSVTFSTSAVQVNSAGVVIGNSSTRVSQADDSIGLDKFAAVIRQIMKKFSGQLVPHPTDKV